MKYKIILILNFAIGFCSTNGQNQLTVLKNLDTLYVSDIKTTHLMFEENIKYVDIGSPYFVADTLQQQIIRIKHTGEGLEDNKSQISNLTVITENGGYYSINLGFDRFTNFLSYTVPHSGQFVYSIKQNEEEKIESEKAMASLCERTEKSNNNVKITNERNDDLEIRVSGIFYIEEKIAIRMEIKNESTIDFDIDHILFRTKLNKRFTSDYLYQERVILPIHTCSNYFEIIGGGHNTITVLFDKFMLNKKERLYIDIIEQNGGRSTAIYIPRKKLLKPKII